MSALFCPDLSWVSAAEYCEENLLAELFGRVACANYELATAEARFMHKEHCATIPTMLKSIMQPHPPPAAFCLLCAC